MNKGILIGVGVLVAVVAVVLLVAGGGQASKQQTPQPKTQGAVEAAPVGDVGVEEREIVVTGNEYSFSPAAISVRAGEKIRITFKNTGSLPHNLRVDELGIATKTIAGGKEDSIAQTVEKTGVYALYCNVGDHRKLGMEGTFTVE